MHAHVPQVYGGNRISVEHLFEDLGARSALKDTQAFMHFCGFNYLTFEKDLSYFYSVYKFFASFSACMCPVCVVIACRSQKPASDPLELEIKTAGSYHVGARNWCWVLRSENAFKL